MRVLLLVLTLAAGLLPSAGAMAQTLDASRFRIEWQVVNRFRLFQDDNFFRLHENAWRQYLLHVDGLNLSQAERDRLVARTSVLGSEHVLNDRFIAFSSILRKNFDWRGWAAREDAATCYDPARRRHSACGGIESYLEPTSHRIALWLSAAGGALPQDAECEWRINGAIVATAPCSERVSGPAVALPYPEGGVISVNAVGEQPIFVDAKVRDLLIAGMGDSFASGEGNPNRPVAFQSQRRHRNLYPLRTPNDASGSARWSDTLCHRSLYGQHLRAALQIAIEHPHVAVTFLDYSCSGASIDKGILGPQTYVERMADTREDGRPIIRPISGEAGDAQIIRLLGDLCRSRLRREGDIVVCPDGNFRRPLDFLFLSVGGNDLGFSNVVAWASLRDGLQRDVASFFGATVSAGDFLKRLREDLPPAYARLARAIARSLPVRSAGDGMFDPSRVILTAYPDMVTEADGTICQAARSSDDEDRYPANQSLDMFGSWLTIRPERLAQVRDLAGRLHRRMRELADDHGWTFADRAYADRMFEGHGFCAQNLKRIDDPAEMLMIPCWGKAERDTQTCQSDWSAAEGRWRPYDPSTENYPYALRQRWVRTFNDAYMVVNQKVTDRSGRISERASEAVFSETVGALHPTAEGHAAMADAILLALRPTLYDLLYGAN